MKTNIDHLVIGAASLQQGVEHVKQQLGVEIPFGGVHEKMGTHNHLMQLGENLFLEVISINPDIPPPEQPRWFGLDDPNIRQRISRQPTLLTWVVNSSDIDTLMQKTDFCFGRTELISRGNISWQFGLPDDGRLLAGGMLPYVMQWNTPTHPAVSMHDGGCRLKCLTLHHANIGWLTSILDSIAITANIQLEPLPKNSLPYMVASIETPGGTKELSSELPINSVKLS